MDNYSSQSLYNMVNLSDKGSIELYPTEANLTLIIIYLSGTIIDTPLNNTFRFSGSSYLPA